MPERQVGPVLPANVAGGEVREAREERPQPALVNEAGDAPPVVVEAGAPVAAPGSDAPGSGDLAPPPPPGPTANPPPAPVATPAPAAPSAAPVEPAPAPAEAADREREALLERLEALEREAREIREELEKD
jgi:2-oxoglutarate dehydrogenase E2 component (dihydrolipoamide succinyltransferase)